MRVALISSECVPFIKTGGLADVTGTLPNALRGCGVEAYVIIPKYSMIPQHFRESMQHMTDFYTSMGWRNQYVGADMLEIDGIKYYFADNEYYFKQDYVYSGGDFETERFCWFCRAAIEIMEQLNIVPDVLHLNDWQSGLIAPLLRTQYAYKPQWSKTRTVFTIHNLRYQGLMSPRLVNDMLGLGQDCLEKTEYYCNTNAMKAGIVYSDIVSTVSPTYAKEICTPRYGETLDGLIRTRGDCVIGILNGIDRQLYNPWKDPALAARFSKNSSSGKKKCKLALQSELGLHQDPDAPIVSMISRLTNQKGIDLVEAVIPGLLDLGAQIVILGIGDMHYQHVFGSMQAANPGRFAFRSEMDDAIARRIYAGSDMFLMPSAFEPCGLSQMFALRYGCIPIVRETGGLADSVMPYNCYTDEGNGFSFRNYSANELYNAARMAIELFRENKDAWERLVFRAMDTDLGWERSAKEYRKLYERLTS
ncbi:MAG: glycogen synthase [Christensenellaceae bacterium]|nr:glycogen synthase [Christensenellaceae bacterium]